VHSTPRGGRWLLKLSFVKFLERWFRVLSRGVKTTIGTCRIKPREFSVFYDPAIAGRSIYFTFFAYRPLGLFGRWSGGFVSSKELVKGTRLRANKNAYGDKDRQYTANKDDDQSD
jgi:hypothetical protein